MVILFGLRAKARDSLGIPGVDAIGSAQKSGLGLPSPFLKFLKILKIFKKESRCVRLLKAQVLV